MAKPYDLNKSSIPGHDPEDYYDFENHNCTNGRVTVYFKDIEAQLIKLISNAEIVVGCVAWLTSEPILKALSTPTVAIVVQKEDFLRPDISNDKNWATRLRLLYNGLTVVGSRYVLGDLVSSLSTSWGDDFSPVRCVGNYNSDKKPAFPRMHNKFLVFCEWSSPWRPYEKICDELSQKIHTYLQSGGKFLDDTHNALCSEFPKQPELLPLSVWTGSFNFTKNAGMSLENALLIKDEIIARAYFDEWQQIFGISEPLDWTSTWVEPEWRVGT